MKVANYFSHDYNARNDPKLQRVLMKYGCVGIGVFWCIIEQLFEQGGELEVANYESMAFSLRVDVDVVRGVVEDFDLFKTNGDIFWSESAKDRINKRLEISEKGREYAQRRWKKDCQTVGNEAGVADKSMGTQRVPNGDPLVSEWVPNAIKEKKRKEKEIKDRKKIEKKEPIFADAKTLSLEERKLKFKESLKPFLPKYGSELLNEFFRYWAEPSTDQKKMRFEAQKFWSVGGRLATWASKTQKYNQNDKAKFGINAKPATTSVAAHTEFDASTI